MPELRSMLLLQMRCAIDGTNAFCRIIYKLALEALHPTEWIGNGKLLVNTAKHKRKNRDVSPTIREEFPHPRNV
ncbi:hypothetical protein D3C85_1849060 [compost metagenome]